MKRKKNNLLKGTYFKNSAQTNSSNILKRNKRR